MINRLRGRFEAHDDVDIELSPGLTTICGPNDRGKSAIRRMIQWVALNSPRGDSMVPWTGKREASSTLDTDLGSVTRQRKGAKNSYVVGDKLLEALGTSVPEEVFDVLKLDTINIQSQVDQYFLLTSSSGEVAKRINKVAGIDSSDEAIRHTKKLISATDSSIKEIEGDILNAQQFIERHEPGIKEAESALEYMLELETKVLEKSERLGAAKSLLTDIKESKRKLDSFPDFEDISDRLSVTAELAAKVDKQDEFIRNAHSICAQLNSIDLKVFDVIEKTDTNSMAELRARLVKSEATLAAAKELSDKLRSIDLERFSNVDSASDIISKISTENSDINLLDSALARAKELAAAIKGFNMQKFAVLDEINLDEFNPKLDAVKRLGDKIDIMRSMKEAEALANELKATAEEADSELSKIQTKCPTCGQRIATDDINHIHS